MVTLGNRLRTVTVAALVVVAGGSLPAPSATQAPTVTEIDSCTSITDPGRYVLTDDVTWLDEQPDFDCLSIRADDVVLDGAGHTVDGGDATAYQDVTSRGIRVNASKNVTVTDLSVTNWHLAISYENESSGTVRETTASDSFVGIFLQEFSDSTVTNSTATNNDVGVLLSSSTRTTMSDVTVRRNNVTGIELSDADRNLVVNATIANTLGTNLYGSDPSGILLTNATGNRLVDSEATNNRNWTYYSRLGSSDNAVENLSMGSLRVSFTGRDFALTTATALRGERASQPAQTVQNPILVSNTSARSWLDLNVSYAGPEPTGTPPTSPPTVTERTTVSPTTVTTTYRYYCFTTRTRETTVEICT